MILNFEREMMTYKDLDIKISYISYGDDNIAASLIVPALKCTKLYRRSVGFFSSSVFELIMPGIKDLVKNKGKIELIASPRLNPDDCEAIKAGYDAKEKYIADAFSVDFQQELDKLTDKDLMMLAELIAKGYLDIRLAVTLNEKTKEIGMYHDKLGILEDNEGNDVVFYGSANSSLSGYKNNYEKVRVVKSWIDGQRESVNDELDEFSSLWNGTNPYVSVYEYKDAAKEDIVKVINDHKKTKSSDPIKLRDYQQQAIDAWVKNGYKGFYVMATGTGKTWTAIFSAKRLIQEHPATIVICAPYKHLVKQWSEDVITAFPNAKVIMVFGENANWENEIKQEIIRKKLGNKTQLIIISTIASFTMDRFKTTLSALHDDKLLIVDEAHRFKELTGYIRDTYKYMLGLSATPFSGKSAESGNKLMNFFGGKVFNLPIEDALGKFLVNYYYHPIYVYATEDEEERFNGYTPKIASCFKNGNCIDPERLAKYLRGRLRVISMAQEKIDKLHSIIDKIKDHDHVVVYCGDGKLFDNEGDEIRHITIVKKALNDAGYRASQFTAKENMQERMELVDNFTKGTISALAAIRCLDEGINIPSIKSALILSSNDDYREFVQRRGRILRQYGDKQYADIYDVIVLPEENDKTWASIEFRRFYEYAKLALNSEELLKDLDVMCNRYGLDIDTIGVFDYDDEDTEEQLDE